MSAELPRRDDDERALLDRAAGWPGVTFAAELRSEALRQLAVTHGHDFAVAVLYDRLRRSPEHGPFIRRVEASPANILRDLAPPCLVAIVPGAFYRERPDTGADGRRLLAIAARLGCRAECIPVASFGSPTDNGRIVRDWLTARATEKVVLVALSKGSLDVRAALGLPGADRAFRNVTTWVNLSGLFQGTGLVNWLRRSRLRSLLVRAYCWWNGYRFATLADLARRPVGSVRLPSHLRVVHVLGFPLRRHLHSPLARRAFARLEPLGPNDGGGNLLADAWSWPGVVFPVWGTDHYLWADWDVDGLIARVLMTAVRDIPATPTPVSMEAC
jgi:hypothetical protein